MSDKDRKTYRTSYVEDMLLDMDHAPGGAIVYYGDGEQEIIHVNQYVLDLVECATVDEFLALTHGTFRGLVCEDDLEIAEQNIQRQIEDRHKLNHVYYRVKTATGKLVSVDDYGRVTTARRNDRPVYHVFVIEMTDGGAIDWLTGLPGMAHFHDLVRMGAKSIRLRGERPVALAFDLTGLKAFNTHHGREKGNVMLRTFAAVLRSHFGREACSRFSEDHFYAFASERDLEKTIKSVFADFKKATLGDTLPVRAGVYVCEDSDDVIAVGLDRAKYACDHDRNTWQSHITWFTESMRKATSLRMHVLNNLDRAIEEGWVHPHYQAILRSSSGVVCGEEALARWEDPEYGALAPATFIPVLEEAGVLQRLDLYMVDCVLRDINKRREMGMPVLPVSVNISLRDIGRLNVAREVTKRCDALGVSHDLLSIEFTESAASDDPEFLRMQIKQLHEAGFEVWMDDFGSGHTSMNIMQNFDFDLIKLDMRFFDHGVTERSQTVVEGIIRMAGRLGLKTLAEGVEEQEEANVLERMGCDMVQGYFFMPPAPLEDITASVVDDKELTFEDAADREYCDAVSLVDLNSMAAYDDADFGATPVTQMPAGVLERRGDEWCVLRANDSYRELLHRWSDSPLTFNLRSLSERGEQGILHAIEQSHKTGSWTHVDGDLGYGTEYQFYVRPYVSTGDKQSYLIVGAPSMLGSALGIYGDVPVAYAVFKGVFDETGTKIVDTEYVYANPLYYEWVGFEQGTLTGTTFLSGIDGASDIWLPYCQRAIVDQEKVHDVVYSNEINHWLSFNIEPSPVQNCCVYAFTLVDDEQRERDDLIVGRDTSDLIIAIADALSGEVSYDTAMNNMLETMSHIIHPDRCYIYERGPHTTSNTFEWCAPGVSPRIERLQDMDNEDFYMWEELIKRDSVMLIPDVEQISEFDERWYDELHRQGVTNFLAVPFMMDGELLGYLCAENYRLDENVDTRRLLATMASFIGARIANRRLLDRLEWTGMHDGLTGLLNRWGIDHVINDHLQKRADDPYVLALMDVDDFKTVNDVHGHDVGDCALETLAGIVTEVFPKGTILGRNGGDEFLAMVVGEDAARIDQILDELFSRELGCTHEGTWYPLSMSVGYAKCPEQAKDLKEAYSHADEALYAVKLEGKSSYRGFSYDLDRGERTQLGFTPRDFIENVPGAVVIHRAGDGEILFANDETVRLFGCDDFGDFLELVGGTYAGVIHPDDRQRVRDEMAEQDGLEAVAKTDHVSFRIVTKQGDVCRVLQNGRGVMVEGMGEVFYELIIDIDLHSLA